MTRVSFMKELESLLCNISSEERESALRYYEDYFEDAGVDKEADIIAELGSPKRVAEIILLEINNGMAMNESSGIYTENGYKNTNYGDYKYEVISHMEDDSTKEQINSEQTTQEDDNTYNNTEHNNQYDKKENDYYDNSFHTYKEKEYKNPYSNYYKNPYGDQREEREERYTDRRKSNLWLIIILAIFAIPVGLPLLIAFAAVVFSLGITALALFFAMGGMSIGILVGGIVTFITGFIIIFTMPINGIFVIGIGLILLGLGIILSLLSYRLIKAVVPRVIRGIVNILRRPFHRKRVIA